MICGLNDAFILHLMAANNIFERCEPLNELKCEEKIQRKTTIPKKNYHSMRWFMCLVQLYWKVHPPNHPLPAQNRINELKRFTWKGWDAKNDTNCSIFIAISLLFIVMWWNNEIFVNKQVYHQLWIATLQLYLYHTLSTYCANARKAENINKIENRSNEAEKNFRRTPSIVLADPEC